MRQSQTQAQFPKAHPPDLHDVKLAVLLFFNNKTQFSSDTQWVYTRYPLGIMGENPHWWAFHSKHETPTSKQQLAPSEHILGVPWKAPCN
jgi:hypothetical protein